VAEVLDVLAQIVNPPGEISRGGGTGGLGVGFFGHERMLFGVGGI